MKIVLLILLLVLTGALVSWGIFNMSKASVDNKLIQPQPSPSVSEAPKKEPLKVKVSIPYWDQKNAAKSFKENVDLINYVSFFWYFLGDDGQIHKYAYAKEDLPLISFAHEKGVKVEVVITNLDESGDWDSDRVKRVLQDENLQKKHIKDLVELADRLDIGGIDIDYEQLNKDLKDDLSKFIQDLGQALREKDKYLGVALHPKSDDGVGNENGALAQDWQEISKGADNLYIMAFNEHWDESGPGSIASIAWVERIVKYAQSLGIDRSKLFLTIPLFGYDWKNDSERKARGLTYSDVIKLLNSHAVDEEWDEDNASAYFHYEDGGERKVWFENARSVAKKIELAQKAGFRGITFWRLGGEDPQIWPSLKSKNSLP